MQEYDLIATAAFGLEAIVKREIKSLGYEPEVVGPGRILFRGGLEAICQANLWLRTADRVLIRVGHFSATDFGVLFDQTTALPWHEWIPAAGAFPVKGRSIKSQLSSVPACQKIVKKAIVEKLLAAHGTERLDETGPAYVVEVGLLEDQVSLTLDTTGIGLHKRGYRTLVGDAPLKETLAAALVMLTFWKPERPLLDPFCGSGTIPIEAAMIGRNMAPGLKRSFVAEEWPVIGAELWATAREQAAAMTLDSLPRRIMGTDIDAEAIKLSRFHAEQAGVSEDIHFQQKAFAELSSKRDYGCMIANPPYGERLADADEINELYSEMPSVLRRLKTWSHYILTSRRDFEQLVGQKADRRRKLYNARIECTYFQFHGPRPTGKPDLESDPEKGPVEPKSVAAEESVPAKSDTPSRLKVSATPVQAFGGLSAKALEQAEIFRSRLTKRVRHLRRWPTKQGITCYRLYERDIPEIPLVVDRYEDQLHIAEYERPHDRTPAEHADWLELMKRTAAEVLDIHPSSVSMKYRDRQRGKSQYERRGGVGAKFVVNEGGLKFEVNLADYIDTGLFLDHRITRGMVRDEARGKRFLNLFAYTGAFSVYAAAGGAASTTTVDLSGTYLQWAQRNMRLNGFEGSQHHFVEQDTAQFLIGHSAGASYDLAIVDPPTFSNSKKTEADWSIQEDYIGLLEIVAELMAPGGVVYFSTNFRRFKFDVDNLSTLEGREISRQTVPPDFRNQRIHRCWRLVRQ